MSWDGKKIEEICKEYGAIEKIKLYRKSQSRRKDFAFVEFVSQESALSCVEGLSKALLEQDETKVYIFPILNVILSIVIRIFDVLYHISVL